MAKILGHSRPVHEKKAKLSGSEQNMEHGFPIRILNIYSLLHANSYFAQVKLAHCTQLIIKYNSILTHELNSATKNVLFFKTMSSHAKILAESAEFQLQHEGSVTCFHAETRDSMYPSL